MAELSASTVFGAGKNQLELTLKAVAYNLKRMAKILEQQNA
jgi:hypothetical protein